MVAAKADKLFDVYVAVPPAPNATELPSVPVNVSVFDAVSVLPSAMVSVEPVAGAVIATLFTDVAVATPIVGVTSVGDVAKTGFPVPVGVLFFSSFPVVPSNSAGTASVALAGPTTSPEPAMVAHVPSPLRYLVASPEAGAGTRPLVPPEPESPIIAFRMAVDWVADRTSGTPVDAVVRPMKLAVAMFAIFARVTALLAMVAANDPVPLPVTSPVSEMV